MHGLPEAPLDFEAVAIEQDDFHRLQSQIGGQQKDRAAVRMTNNDEAHQPGRWTSRLTACKLWPMMYSGFELLADC
jgi:hypothetical protein